MTPYVPNGMLQHQLDWETINTCLLKDLSSQTDQIEDLSFFFTELLILQANKVESLKQMGKRVSSPLVINFLPYKKHLSISDTLFSLLNRLSQMLQEYKSYETYFLKGYFDTNVYIKHLYSSTQKQLDILTQLEKLPPLTRISLSSDNHQSYYLENGYTLTKIESELTYPTSLAFDEEGTMYVAESGFAYGEDPSYGRILKLKDGQKSEVASGFSGPLTGLTYFKGFFYVAIGSRGKATDGGCGEIIKVSKQGYKQTLVSGLKTCGDHFTGDIVIGPDHLLYFGVGTATNSSIVGMDNQSWLKHSQQVHDTPSRSYRLSKQGFITPNPLCENSPPAVTYPFHPFNSEHFCRQLEGQLYSNGVIYQSDLNGHNLKIISDGFRNPFGLQFSPFDHLLYVSDNGADARGSRQINGDWDNLWRISQTNSWFGWPDFFSGLPCVLDHFHVDNQAKPHFVIRNHPFLASQPITRLEPHSSSNKFDFSTNMNFGFKGDLFIAQLGNIARSENDTSHGFSVVRVNPQTGQVFPFYLNRDGEKQQKAPIRPIETKFSTDGEELYILDFGVLGSMALGMKPKRLTGSIWKVTKNDRKRDGQIAPLP